MQSFYASREIRWLEFICVPASGFFFARDGFTDFVTPEVFPVLSLVFVFEPYRVDVTETGKVRFYRLVGTREYEARDIVRISGGPDCYAIVFPSKTIRLSPFFGKLPALKAALMEFHPGMGLDDRTSEPGYVKKAGIWTTLLPVLFAAFLIVKFLFFFRA